MVLAVSGCGSEVESVRVEQWQVSPIPAVTIGIAEGEQAYELHGASDAVVTSDGRIIIANSGSSELRVFDSTGSYVQAIGRQGGGPGEFRGTITLFPHAADSLIVHDSGNGRFSVLAPDGTFARRLEVEPRGFSWDDWLHAGAWVSGVRNPTVRPCVAAALRAIPVPEIPDPPVRRVILDEAGRIWVRPLGKAASSSWRLYSLAGAPLGDVVLPTGFRPYHIGADFILGSHTGADDSERIELYRMTPPQAAVRADCNRPALTAESVIPTDLGADLNNAVMAQEVHFADHHGYAALSDSLQWTSAVGATLTIVAANEGGWAGVLTSADGGPICAIAVGDFTPAGWSEGVPRCSVSPTP
jgi:hypothetical protein